MSRKHRFTLEKYLPTFILLIVGLVVISSIFKKISAVKRHYFRGRRKNYVSSKYNQAQYKQYADRSKSNRAPDSPSAPNYNNQINAVVSADFTTRKILNFDEYNVFRIAEECVRKVRGGHRVFAQTCLGEILRTEDTEARKATNSKRIDIVITDKIGHAVIAIEYQGSGHTLDSTYAHRDTVKRTALQKAGVEFLEVFQKDTEEEIRTRILSKLNIHNASQLAQIADQTVQTQPEPYVQAPKQPKDTTATSEPVNVQS